MLKRWMLAVAGLALAAGLFAAGYGSGVATRVAARTTVTADGLPVRYAAAARPEITALEVTIGPGAATGWHTHPCPVYAWVLAGTLEVELADGRKTVYRPGQAIIEAVATAHQGRTIGAEAVRLGVFYLGEVAKPLTVKVATPAGRSEK